MRILITGSSGLIGSALRPAFATAGHSVIRLVRSGQGGLEGQKGHEGQEANPAEGAILWDPRLGSMEPGERARLEGLDAVVHLAGESIAGGRWTAGRKAKIRDSRVLVTRFLATVLAGLERPPRVMVCASAVGYYGDRGDEVLTEESSSGEGFLAGLCQEWEQAAEPAREKGIRVVNLRIGLVLSGAGGALKQMLTPFRLGLGGVIGSGRQYWSWIAIDDVVGAFQHALITDSLRGPVNTVGPGPVTNREFTRTLGRVISRPTVFPLPAFAARLAFGDMANELLLAGQRVEPRRLIESGYEFRFRDLDAALRHVLNR
ncbi:MAG TPA: TIGR01777 family oxidoreductase [Terriglobia bacterium]|nr:TIGR01777 family oxidoreductase [Terriglobia bacterium]